MRWKYLCFLPLLASFSAKSVYSGRVVGYCPNHSNLLQTTGMDGNLITGTIVVVTALVLLTYLVIWSVWAIGRISRSRSHTAREALKELNGGR